MRFKIIVTIFIGFLVSANLYGQVKKEKSILDVEVPEKKFNIPDTTSFDNGDNSEDNVGSYESSGNDEYEGDTSSFDLRKKLSILDEDSTEEKETYTNIVEVSEQLNIDSIWVTMYEYYSIWDNQRVNPYKINPENMKDTLKLPLFSLIKGTAWSPPIKSYITSNFGMRRYRYHYGTDLELDIGDSIVAAFDGIVRIARFNPGGFGNYVLVRHYNGLETIYGHLSAFKVKVGQVVKAGELIGLGGNTGRSSGPHLHFEIRFQGNAINPGEVFDFLTGKILKDTLEITSKTFSYLKKAREVYYHKVRRGDTLSKISRKYGVPVGALCRLNRIKPRTILKVGRRLRVK